MVGALKYLDSRAHSGRRNEDNCTEVLCRGEDFMNPKVDCEILDENTDRCAKRRNSYVNDKDTKRLIRYLIATQFPTKDPSINVDGAVRKFTELLLAQFHTKDSWHEIKVKTEHPRYRIMAEMARLKTTTACRGTNQPLLRFSLHQSCVKVPSQDLFAFVFSLKSKDEDTRLCLVRTVAYMFSDQSNCEENGANTIQDCYEWATDTSNDVRKLTTEYQGRKLPVLQCLRYVMIKPNAIVEMYNEKMKNRFQEGILHKDNYECESHGRINCESLEFVKLR